MSARGVLPNNHLIGVLIEAVPFELVSWDFEDDGFAGAIFFRVPSGVFLPGSNNGASYFEGEYEGGANVRVATPCLKNGESEFLKMPFIDFITEAAEFAVENLRTDSRA